MSIISTLEVSENSKVRDWRFTTSGWEGEIREGFSKEIFGESKFRIFTKYHCLSDRCFACRALMDSDG